MKKYKDLKGQRFGSLTAIQRIEGKTSISGNLHWLCKCDCGKMLIVRSDNLSLGHTTRCTDCRPNHRTTSVFVEKGDDYGVV